MEYSAGFFTARTYRLLQFGLAASTVYFMILICDHLACFPSYKLGLIAMGLQAFWSLFMAIVNCYEDFVNSWVQGYYGAVYVYKIGNWVMSTLTFVAACASAATFTSCVEADHDNWFVCYFLIGMVALSELLCCSLTLLLFLPTLRQSMGLLD
ncbi:hypothetical protein LguiA_029765 [Lonicera macranthoides]